MYETIYYHVVEFNVPLKNKKRKTVYYETFDLMLL